jgi:hypothetical protein
MLEYSIVVTLPLTVDCTNLPHSTKKGNFPKGTKKDHHHGGQRIQVRPIPKRLWQPILWKTKHLQPFWSLEAQKYVREGIQITPFEPRKNPIFLNFHVNKWTTNTDRATAKQGFEGQTMKGLRVTFARPCDVVEPRHILGDCHLGSFEWPLCWWCDLKESHWSPFPFKNTTINRFLSSPRYVKNTPQSCQNIPKSRFRERRLSCLCGRLPWWNEWSAKVSYVLNNMAATQVSLDPMPVCKL